jgi:hypothetical protein
VLVGLITGLQAQKNGMVNFGAGIATRVFLMNTVPTQEVKTKMSLMTAISI